MTTEKTSKEVEAGEAGLARRLGLGVGLVATLVAAVGGWAAHANLAGAVIAPGLVVVDSSIKKVQHPTGGVVGRILVKSGDHVSSGDLLVALDDTQTRANLGIVLSQLTELTGRKARLNAESDRAEGVIFPEGFAEQNADALRVALGERRLFEAKRQSSEGKRAQLRSRIEQYRHEIAGLEKQEKSKSRELVLVSEELERLEDLYKKQLMPVTRILSMERDATRIAGEHGSILSQIARINGQISEVELQIIEIDETTVTEAQKELRDVEARIAELQERRIAAEDVMRRIEIRAPRSGIVHELAVHTEGGVIGPGDTVMGIVPDEDERAIEVRLSPTDIDQVSIGQKVILRFPAFNQRTTPEVNGQISLVAADLTRDQQSGQSYYTARVSVTEEDLKKLGNLQLVAGMPVESFIQTGERTALSYLTKPLTDQVARAFKEE
jgi:HlyD family secretion protein